MLKTIIKNIATVVGDNKSVADCSNNISSEKINEYIALINFVVAGLSQDYLCYSASEDVVSSQSGEVDLKKLNNTAIKILGVYNNGKKISAKLFADKLINLQPNTAYSILYAYLPKEITSLDDEIYLPFGIDYTILVAGAVSEFYFKNMQYTEAANWEKKYKEKLKNFSLPKNKYYKARVW